MAEPGTPDFSLVDLKELAGIVAGVLEKKGSMFSWVKACFGLDPQGAIPGGL